MSEQSTLFLPDFCISSHFCIVSVLCCHMIIIVLIIITGVLVYFVFDGIYSKNYDIPVQHCNFIYQEIYRLFAHPRAPYFFIWAFFLYNSLSFGTCIACMYTVESSYNKDVRAMKFTLLYQNKNQRIMKSMQGPILFIWQVSHYIRALDNKFTLYHRARTLGKYLKNIYSLWIFQSNIMIFGA